MVSLRGLQSTSSEMETGRSTSTNTSTASALTSATESTSSTGTTTTSAATTAPSSSSRSVTTKKETTSSGELITTVTTTTTTVSSSTSNASSSTTSSTSNIASNGTTSEGNTVTKGNAGSVSITTITTTEGENGSSPVTTVTTDNGVNTTSTSTTKDAVTGITTVTTITKSDTDMNGSASSSTTWVTTSSGSSGVVGTTESTTATETSNAAGSSASTSTTAALSSAEATMEGASSSTTSTSTSRTTEGNSVSSITDASTTGITTSTGGNSASTTSGTATNGAIGTITTTGSTNSGANSATATASSGTAASSTTTSTTNTSTSSSTGSANGASNIYTSSGAANSATTSTTTTSSANGVATTTASSGEKSTTTTTVSTDGSKASNDASETSTTSTAASSEGSTSSANTSMTGSSSMSTPVVSSSGSSSTSSSLASWFTSNFRDDETQLVVGAISSTTTAGEAHQVCDGLPALVTRSSTETPNGGCPDELTSLNASCTCLTGYSETASSWAFHVTTESWNSTTSTTTRSLTQSSSDELAINTIRPIWVSSSLETLVIEGAGEAPVEIEFIDENRIASGSSLNLVRSASNSTNVSTLSLYNLDLNSVSETNSDFVPATVTNLTLRKCNISTLSTSFTRDWSWLQYLDLSSNNIDTAYIGGADLKELNLSHNALAVFPAGSLNSSGLQALYIQGNDITDFNVSQEQFEKIQGLTAFTADQPESSSTCQDGAWQSAHGTTFCVLGASTAAVPDPSRSSASSSDDDHDGLGLLGYWLIAGAIIVFFLLLLVLWQRRRHSRERESSPMVSPEAVEPTTPKYNGDDAFGDALNRDAGASAVAFDIAAGVYANYRSHGNSVDSEDTALGVSLSSALASCRLDYGEVTLGRCISRGGFGLVFVGSYRGQQVAVKKIRNDCGVGHEQVEQFVREISLISALNHPRIVEFIGACWTTPAELSAVTELMERGDLRDVTRRFKRRGYRLTWEAHKAVIALHIAEALTYLHGLSPTVIHRDLKAKNVLLNADMEAKLSDFGIARERSFYDGSEHMTVGIGTSFWIAPEVLLGRDYDERADIYSFGVVLSEIDTDDYPYWNAQHPPQGKVQENDILRLVARGAKRPAFSDDCPPAILELAARCLRADPEERPSASDIVVYLQELVQDRNSSPSFSSMVRPGNSFDFSTNNSSPTRTAPANTIVNLRPSGQQIQESQAMAVPSSAAAAYAAGKHTTKTTTTTTTKVASSSIGAGAASNYRPAAAEALAPAHEVVVSSPQVTHQVVRTKLPPKGKRATTTATTTTRRAEQGSAGAITGGHFTTGMIVDNKGRGFGSERIPSSPSHARLSFGGPTSPASLRANHQAALDNLNQQRQLSSSSGEASADGIDRRGQRWAVYENVKEL